MILVCGDVPSLIICWLIGMKRGGVVLSEAGGITLTVKETVASRAGSP